VLEVARARDAYFAETGIYVPICSDGGIVYDYHMTLALAMGADFIMLGRYFARFDESPDPQATGQWHLCQGILGEGSNRARNWQRYDDGGEAGKMAFEEGVDSYVPYAGKLKDNLDVSMAKIRATSAPVALFRSKNWQQKAAWLSFLPPSIVEGGATMSSRRKGTPRLRLSYRTRPTIKSGRKKTWPALDGPD
jgi:IMP dehydrogenase